MNSENPVERKLKKLANDAGYKKDQLVVEYGLLRINLPIAATVSDEILDSLRSYCESEAQRIEIIGSFSLFVLDRLLGKINATKLEKLDISGMDIGYIGLNNWDFPKLKTVKLNHVRIKKVPFFLNRCTELENLDMSNSALKKFKINESDKLSVLRLSNTRVERINCFICMPNLHILDVRNSPFCDSTGICDLKFLEALYMGHTSIGSPPDIRGLEHLEYLDLSDTQISDLYHDFDVCIQPNSGFPCQLKFLDISRTKINRLPLWLNKAKNLLCLNLAELTLDNFSKELYQIFCTNVAAEPLSRGETVFKSENLEWLLDDKSLPNTEVYRGVYLPRVRFSDMDVRYLTTPHNGLQCSEYYESVEKDINREVQLVFCGEALRDNISLVHQLLSISDYEYQHTKDKKSIRYISELNIEYDDGRRVFDTRSRISYLEIEYDPIDAVGRPIFTGEDNLYVVLLDGSNMEGFCRSALWWARYIELFAPWSEIVFMYMDINVENKNYEPSFFLNSVLGIQTKIHHISIPKNEGHSVHGKYLDEIRNKLKKIIVKFPEYTKKIPVHWQNVRNHLRSRLNVYEVVSITEFEGICRRYGVGSDAYINEELLIRNEADDEYVANEPVWHSLKRLFVNAGLCFEVIIHGHEKMLYSPVRMMIGIYRAIRLASIKGIITVDELYEDLWDAVTPSVLPFSRIDAETMIKCLVDEGLCAEATKPGRYIFPLFLSFTPKPDEIIEGSVPDKEEYRNWLNITNFEMSNKIVENGVLHYVGQFEFISSTLFSAIVLKTRESFEKLEKDKNAIFKPIGSTMKKREPYSSWIQMATYGAFFALRDNSSKPDITRVYIGRSLDVNGQLHIYVNCEHQRNEEYKKPSAAKELAAVVMQAVHSVYKELPGYKLRSRYHFSLDLHRNKRAALIPLDEIKRYYYNNLRKVYIAALDWSVDVAKLYDDYYISE